MQDSLSLLPFLAEAAPSAPTGTGLGGNIIIMILLFGAMWFLLIAPQRKRQKQQAQMIKELTVGDNVITAGGIYGTITNVKDDRLVIKIADNTRIEVVKNAIQTKVTEQPAQQQ